MYIIFKSKLSYDRTKGEKWSFIDLNFENWGLYCEETYIIYVLGSYNDRGNVASDEQ